jgi:hypothetical protein
MVENTREIERQNLVSRLTAIRDAYQRCVSDVSAEAANNGSEWSIVDLLRHVTGGYYQGMITRLLEEDNPQMGGGGFDPEASWKRIADNILADINWAIGIATDLTTQQIGRSGERRGQTVSVLGTLAGWADHFDEHLAQLRDEIRPREGLSQV